MSITPAGGWNRPDEGEVQQPLKNYTRTPSVEHVVVYEKKSSGSAFGKAFFGCLGVLFALWCVFFGTGFINGFMKGFSSSFQAANNQSVTAPTVETLRVSAPALNAAYQANEVAADEKYTHKILRVFGSVKSIDKDAFGAVHIRIYDDSYFSGSLLGVDAKLHEGNEGVAAGLYIGQSVAVRCPDVRYVVGTVMLEDCSFESVERTPQTPTQTPTASGDQPYNY